jgi:hypothetical protein
VSIVAEIDLKQLQRNLKAAGNTGLSRELNKGINHAVVPLKKEIPRSALLILPGRGGLNKRVAGSKMSVRKMSNGIRLVLKNDYQLTYMDNPGKLRHPVFPRRSRTAKALGRSTGSSKLHANRKKWAWESQKIKPGFFTKPVTRAGEQVRKDIVTAMENVVRQIEGK